MKNKFEELKKIKKFLKSIGKEVPSELLFQLLDEESDISLSRISEKIGFTDEDYKKIKEFFKPLWSGKLNIDNTSPLKEVIRSFLNNEISEVYRTVDKEIWRYWPLLSDSLVEQIGIEYTIMSLSNNAPSWIIYDGAIDIPLAIRFIQDMGYHPAGLREVIALCNEDPKVREDGKIWNQYLINETIIAPADCFVGKYYPVIHINAKHKFTSRDILSYSDDDFRLTSQIHILVKKI